MFRALLLSALVVLFAAPGIAQVGDLSGFERVLLPIAPGERFGSFGTVWESILTIRNSAGEPVTVFHSPSHFFCANISVPCEPGGPLAPESTITTLDPSSFASPVLTAINSPDRGPGAFLYLERQHSDEVFINSKVREVTAGQQWNVGTEIPAIREREMLTARSELLNVFVPSGTRARLRLYAMFADGSFDPRFRVLVYELDSSVLLAEAAVGLTPSGPGLSRPYYAELVIGSEGLDLPPGTEWLRVVIEPGGAGFSYWAFISVTNNQTQLFSITTPQ